MAGILETAPNPQFARENWIDLTGVWSFRYDDNDIGVESGWWNEDFGSDSREIMVPYPPESELSGINDPSFHPVVWYQRDLPAPVVDHERTLIRFGAVDHEATVWINGVFVGHHIGGSSPFTVEVSTAWLDSLNNRLLTLRVFDNPTDLEQPRGKQGWHREPNKIWYKRTTGIWQPVWMESAPRIHIDYLRWVYNEKNRSLQLEVELNRAPTEALSVNASVVIPGKPDLTTTILLDGRTGSATISLNELAATGVLESLLWSPDSPTLLPTQVRTTSGDDVRGYIGLRAIDLNKSGYRINNKPVWLSMVLSQGYFPESHYAAPSLDAIRREVELTLSLGFNGARTHQKAEDPRYLYWADRLGLLIWGEIGAAQLWSDRGMKLLANEWAELVRRDINHPSIITWAPFNESWGVSELLTQEEQRDAVRAMYALTNALDGTRPVVGYDGWEHVGTDIFSLHDYHWDGDILVQRYGNQSNEDIALQYLVAGRKAVAATDLRVNDLPLMISEFGGVSFMPNKGEKWFGYGMVTVESAFVEKYRELTEALHNCPDIIGVCYTQLTDTEQETNGLLYADRTPKVDIDMIRSITRGARAAAV